MPTDRYQQRVKLAPQVTLYFREDADEVKEGYSPIDAEISFRVMDETSSSMTEANARNLANNIRTEFATGGGYRWKKGRVKLSYRDKENGYQFSVNAYSESEGKEVINKVLDIQNHVLNLDLLTIATLGDTPPTILSAESHIRAIYKMTIPQCDRLGDECFRGETIADNEKVRRTSISP